MRRCNWCDRWFKNKQAVRGHLRTCKEWIAVKAKGWRRTSVLVDALMCGNCRTGPAPGGHPGTSFDVDAAGGFCHTCNAPGHWVVCGKKRLTADQAQALGLAPGVHSPA